MSDLAKLARLEDPQFYLNDPYPVMQRIRQEDPVFYYEPRDMWVVSKYDDIKYVGRNPEIFSNHDGLFFSDFEYGDITKAFYRPASENIGLIGPPRHGEIRKLIGVAFTPRIIADMRDSVRQMCRDLLDPIEAGKPVNFSRQIAEPLPLMVIAVLMGIPLDECDTMKYYSDEIIKTGYGTSRDELDGIIARLTPMEAFFEKYLDECAHNPRADLLNVIYNARRDGLISHDTAHMLLPAAMTGGNETTRNTINGAIIQLCKHPEQMKLLADQPDLAKRATEEFLRFVSPVRGFGRTVTQETELRGRKMSPGQRVLNFFMSGNRDEDVFEDADTFNIALERRPNVAFGFGEHICPGAAIARMEICILFEEIAARFSHVELVGSPVCDEKQLNFYGWEDVLVVFS
jgi:cytochrome P450